MPFYSYKPKNQNFERQNFLSFWVIFSLSPAWQPRKSKFWKFEKSNFIIFIPLLNYSNFWWGCEFWWCVSMYNGTCWQIWWDGNWVLNHGMFCAELLFSSFFYYSSVLLAFFISNTVISNDRLKLAKNQANAKKHPEAELLLFVNYSHSSSTLSSKNNSTYSKK